jgi:hypothetical protein
MSLEMRLLSVLVRARRVLVLVQARRVLELIVVMLVAWVDRVVVVVITPPTKGC